MLLGENADSSRESQGSRGSRVSSRSSASSRRRSDRDVDSALMEGCQDVARRSGTRKRTVRSRPSEDDDGGTKLSSARRSARKLGLERGKSILKSGDPALRNREKSFNSPEPALREGSHNSRSAPTGAGRESSRRSAISFGEPQVFAIEDVSDVVLKMSAKADAEHERRRLERKSEKKGARQTSAESPTVRITLSGSTQSSTAALEASSAPQSDEHFRMNSSRKQLAVGEDTQSGSRGDESRIRSQFIPPSAMEARSEVPILQSSDSQQRRKPHYNAAVLNNSTPQISKATCQGASNPSATLQTRARLCPSDDNGLCEDELQHPISRFDRVARPLLFNDDEEYYLALSLARQKQEAWQSRIGPRNQFLAQCQLVSKATGYRADHEAYDFGMSEDEQHSVSGATPLTSTTRFNENNQGRESLERGRSEGRRKSYTREQTPFNCNMLVRAEGVNESGSSGTCSRAAGGCDSSYGRRLSQKADQVNSKQAPPLSSLSVSCDDNTASKAEDIRGRGAVRRHPSKRDQTPFNPRLVSADCPSSSDEDDTETSFAVEANATTSQHEGVCLAKQEMSLSFDLHEEYIENTAVDGARGRDDSEKWLPSTDTPQLKAKLSLDTEPATDTPSASHESTRGRDACRRNPSKRDQTPFNRSMLGRKFSDDDNGDGVMPSSNRMELPETVLRDHDDKTNARRPLFDVPEPAPERVSTRSAINYLSPRGRAEGRRKPAKRDQTPFNRAMPSRTNSEDDESEDGASSYANVLAHTSRDDTDTKEKDPRRTVFAATEPEPEPTGCSGLSDNDSQFLSRGRGEARRKPSKRDQTPFNRNMVGKTFSDKTFSDDENSDSGQRFQPENKATASRNRNVEENRRRPRFDMVEPETMPVRKEGEHSSPRGRGEVRRKPSKRDQTPFNRSMPGKHITDDDDCDGGQAPPSQGLDLANPAKDVKVEKDGRRPMFAATESEPRAMGRSSLGDNDDHFSSRDRGEARRKPSKTDQTPFNRNMLGKTYSDDDDSGDRRSYQADNVVNDVRKSPVEQNHQRPLFDMAEPESTPAAASKDDDHASTRNRRRPMFDVAASETSPVRKDDDRASTRSRRQPMLDVVEPKRTPASKEEDLPSSRGRGEARRKPSKRDQTPFNRSMLGKTFSDDDDGDDDSPQQSENHASTEQDRHVEENRWRSKFEDSDAETAPVASQEDNNASTRGRGEGRRRPSKRDQTPFNRSMPGRTFSEEEGSEDGMPSQNDRDAATNSGGTSDDGSSKTARGKSSTVVVESDAGKPGGREDLSKCFGRRGSSRKAKDKAAVAPSPATVHGGSSDSSSGRPGGRRGRQSRSSGRSGGQASSLPKADENAVGSADVTARALDKTGRGREEARPALKKILSNSKRATTREQTPFYISRPLSNASDVDDEYSDICKQKQRGRNSNLPDIAEDETACTASGAGGGASGQFAQSGVDVANHWSAAEVPAGAATSGDDREQSPAREPSRILAAGFVGVPEATDALPPWQQMDANYLRSGMDRSPSPIGTAAAEATALDRTKEQKHRFSHNSNDSSILGVGGGESPVSISPIDLLEFDNSEADDAQTANSSYPKDMPSQAAEDAKEPTSEGFVIDGAASSVASCVARSLIAEEKASASSAQPHPPPTAPHVAAADVDSHHSGGGELADFHFSAADLEEWPVPAPSMPATSPSPAPAAPAPAAIPNVVALSRRMSYAEMARSGGGESCELGSLYEYVEDADCGPPLAGGGEEKAVIALGYAGTSSTPVSVDAAAGAENDGDGGVGGKGGVAAGLREGGAATAAVADAE